MSPARLAGATTLLLALGAAPALAAEPTADHVTLRGAGCSGRPGLPFDAALVAARGGTSAREVLARLVGPVVTVPEHPVVATVADDVATIDAQLPVGGDAYLGPTAVLLPPGALLHLAAAGDGLELTTVDATGAAVRARTDDLLVVPLAGGQISSGGHGYAGSWHVTGRSGRLDVQGRLDLDAVLGALRVPAPLLRSPAALDAAVIAARSAAEAAPVAATVQARAGSTPRELLASVARTRGRVVDDGHGRPRALTLCRTSTGWRRELSLPAVGKALAYVGTVTSLTLDATDAGLALTGDAGTRTTAGEQVVARLHLPGPVGRVEVPDGTAGTDGSARAGAHLAEEAALPAADLPVGLPLTAGSAPAPQLAPPEPAAPAVPAAGTDAPTVQPTGPTPAATPGPSTLPTGRC